MDSVILDVCDEFSDQLSVMPEKIMAEQIQQKLKQLYSRDEEQLDTLLRKLEVSIDYDDYSSVRTIATKLLQIRSRNRVALLDVIRRLG
jgi:tRNA U34 5-carboxymethylaminomethyl modifying GTPase MnmE/TrmE